MSTPQHVAPSMAPPAQETGPLLPTSVASLLRGAEGEYTQYLLAHHCPCRTDLCILSPLTQTIFKKTRVLWLKPEANFSALAYFSPEHIPPLRQQTRYPQRQVGEADGR